MKTALILRDPELLHEAVEPLEGLVEEMNFCNAGAAEIGGDRHRIPVACKTAPVKRARTARRSPSPIDRSLRYTASWVHRLLCSQHAVFTGKVSSQVTMFTVVCEHSVTCSQEHSFTVFAMLERCVAVNRGVGEEMGR